MLPAFADDPPKKSDALPPVQVMAQQDHKRMMELCAPRPVLISCGTKKAGDGWVDAKGMFLAGGGAGPVYKLLGKKGLGTSEFPKVETALVDGEVAFRQHGRGHTTGPNWPTFLKFAERYLKD